MTNSFADWHKSSYSSNQNPECVEQGVDATSGTVGVRDTKQKEKSPILAVSSAGWSAFVASVKSPSGLGGGVA